MNTPKIEKEIQSSLFSTDRRIVIAAIQKIKEKGNKEYLKLLFDFILTEPEKDILSEITQLLGTVKDKGTTPLFISALQEIKYEPIHKIILTACWQNGLDFSNDLPVFVDIVINKEWEIAFEAFTVIENQEFAPSPEIVQEISKMIAEVIETANEQKSYFLNEILKIVQ